MTDQLLTAEEVADRLRVKPDTIVVWARQGRIPARRLSRKVIRFSLSEVIESLEAATLSDSDLSPTQGPGGHHESRS
jgi:excisionase family DNA binding protein